jgi:hypothetical protein
MKTEMTQAEMAQEYREDAAKFRAAAIMHWDWRMRQILLNIAVDYEHAAQTFETASAPTRSPAPTSSSDDR